MFVLVLCQEYQTKRDMVTITLLKCPLAHRCGCINQVKVIENAHTIVVYRYGLHLRSSHDQDESKFLSVSQEQVVRAAVRSRPLTPGRQVRRDMNRLPPAERIDPKLTECVMRLVRKEKQTLFEKELDGVTKDGSYGSIAAVGDKKWFADRIQAHNLSVEESKSDDDERHLKPGTAIVIGKEVNESTKVIHLNISTPHMLLNMARAINSGWNIALSGEGIYCLC